MSKYLKIENMTPQQRFHKFLENHRQSLANPRDIFDNPPAHLVDLYEQARIYADRLHAQIGDLCVGREKP